MWRGPMLRVALLAFVGLRSVAAQTRVEHELIDRASADTASRCAFVDTSLVFDRDGTIMSWDIFASRTGRLSLQVYRPTQTDGGAATYQVVCDSLIKARTADVIVHYELAEDDRCSVQTGDVIGWYHNGPGIIDYVNGGEGSVMWNYPIPQPGFGDAVTFSDGGARTYSIGATVHYGESTPVVEPITCGPCNREHGHCTSATECTCTGGYGGRDCSEEPAIQTIGNELADRQTPDGASGIAFVDTGTVFTRPGRVVAWNFFVGRAGVQRLQVWRRSGDNTYQLIWCVPQFPTLANNATVNEYFRAWVRRSSPLKQCLAYVHSENEVQGSLAGSVEQVEVAEPDQCHVLPQDVVGWWHAGQGVTDFDNGGDEVRWNYGHQQPPAIGDEVTFDGTGARTYSLAVSVVYGDETCTNLQDELGPIVANCCRGGNCADGSGMPATCSAPSCAATFTSVYRKCLNLIAQDPAADVYARFNRMCVAEEGSAGSATSQWCAVIGWTPNCAQTPALQPDRCL